MEIILDTASLNIPQGQQVTNQPAIISAPVIQEIPSEQTETEISAVISAPTIQEIPSEQVESEINAIISAPTILSNILLPSTTGSYTDPYDPDSIRFINNKEVYTCTGMCGVFQEKLSPYQTKLLLNPINIDGTLVTDVEQALITLNSARRQVNVDWDATTGVTAICNKPVLASVATIGTYASLCNKPDFSNVAYTGSYNDLRDVPELSPAATEGQVNADWNATEGVAEVLNKPSLSCVACSGNYNDLTNKPDLGSIQIQSDWEEDNILCKSYIRNKPTLSRVACSGQYADLMGAPVITPQVNADWNAISGVAQILNKPALAPVALSGDYNDLRNIPPDTSKTYSFSFNNDTHKLTVTEHNIFNDNVIFDTVIDTVYSFSYTDNEIIILDNYGVQHTINLGNDFYTKAEVDALIEDITDLIPEQASPTNQLADKAFVNSTIQTATANFRGNWATWFDVPTQAADYPEDYAGSKTPTINDYLVVQDASDYTEQTLEGTWRFKYTGTWSTDGKNGWIPEYQVNETPLTAAQLAALNSGITCEAVAKITDVYNCTISLCNSTGTALLGSFTLNQNQNSAICLNVGTLTGICLNNNTATVTDGCAKLDITPSLSYCSTNRQLVTQLGNKCSSPITLPAGINCTGTVVASDIANFITDIGVKVYCGTTCKCTLCKASSLCLGSNAFNSTAFTTCKGTVTKVTLGTTACSPDTSGNITLPAYPPDLSGCAGLNCTGTVVASDIANFITDIGVKVYCGTTCKCTLCKASSLCLGSNAFNSTAFTTCKGTVTKVTLGTSACSPDTSGNITLPAYPPDLSSCPGLNCTGTVVASDIANFITDIGVKVYCGTTCKCTLCKASSLCLGSNAFNSTAFTTCKGTVTKVTLGTTACSPDTSGNITLPAYPPDLSSCPGLSCTGTLVASDLNGYATESWVTGKNYCIHDCLVKLVKITSSANSADRNILIMGNGFVDGCICPVYFSDTCKLTFNPINGQLKSSIFGYNKGGVTSRNINGYNSKNYTGGTRCTTMDICTFFKCFAACHSLAPAEDLTVKYTWADACNNIICWGTSNSINLSGASVQVCSNSYTVNLFNDSCSGWYSFVMKISCLSGVEYNFRAYKGSNSAAAATIICNMASVYLANTATNATCFGGCTYACAKADIRSGLATIASLCTVATSGKYCDLTGTPSLCTVATSGCYCDLIGTPTIPAADDHKVTYTPHNSANKYPLIFSNVTSPTSGSTNNVGYSSGCVGYYQPSNGSLWVCSLITLNPTACTSTVAGSNGTIHSAGRSEYYHTTPYIDFHHNYACADYSARIINSAAGRLDIMINNATGCTASSSGKTFCFCNNGYMYGNVCGNLCGNAACFGGCTYSQACADIRSGLLSEYTLNGETSTSGALNLTPSLSFNNGTLNASFGNQTSDSIDLSGYTNDHLVSYAAPANANADRPLALGPYNVDDTCVCKVYYSNVTPLTYNSNSGLLKLGTIAADQKWVCFSPTWYCRNTSAGTVNDAFRLLINNDLLTKCSLGMQIGTNNLNRGIYDYYNNNGIATFRWLEYWNAECEVHTQPLYLGGNEKGTSYCYSPYISGQCGKVSEYTFYHCGVSGYPSYRLLYDITDWYNAAATSSSNVAGKGWVGTITAFRCNGWTYGVSTDISLAASYGRRSCNIACCNWCGMRLYHTPNLDAQVVPVVVKDETNNKYWLALCMTGSSSFYKFEGIWSGKPDSTTVLNATDDDGTLPAGWTKTTTGMRKDYLNVYCGSTLKCSPTIRDALCLSANAFNANAQISTTTYPGACCTGTLVASDLNGYATETWVNNKGYTTCKGTVTKVTLGSSACSPDTNGNITLPAYPPDLSSCPGLNCVGNILCVCVPGVSGYFRPDENGRLTLPVAGRGNVGWCSNVTGTCTSIPISNADYYIGISPLKFDTSCHCLYQNYNTGWYQEGAMAALYCCNSFYTPTELCLEYTRCIRYDNPKLSYCQETNLSTISLTICCKHSNDDNDYTYNTAGVDNTCIGLYNCVVCEHGSTHFSTSGVRICNYCHNNCMVAYISLYTDRYDWTYNCRTRCQTYIDMCCVCTTTVCACYYCNLSAVKCKDNIVPFTDGLYVLKNTDFIQYNYKDDACKTSRVSIPADWSNTLIAGSNKDSFDITNSLGITMQAVQDIINSMTLGQKIKLWLYKKFIQPRKAKKLQEKISRYKSTQ